MSWRSFVAVGDSFTEGLDDPYPDRGAFRGWADLVAEDLARDVPEFGYANLAIRGRLFDAIVDDQVPIALRMRPDLISFAGGGNDALRRSFDAARLAARVDEVVRTLRASGADVLLFRFADVSARLPGGRIVRPRAQFLNRVAGEAAERYGARLVDLWTDTEFTNPLLWSTDRLHLNEYGHRRVAAHALTALGRPADPTWWDMPSPQDAHGWWERRGADARWAREHFAPWIKRRLTGRSTGDDLAPKRPALEPLS